MPPEILAKVEAPGACLQVGHEAARNLSKPDRKHLRAIRALLDDQHPSWAFTRPHALDIMLTPDP